MPEVPGCRQRAHKGRAPRDTPAGRKCREVLDEAGTGMLQGWWIGLQSCWLGTKRTYGINSGQVEQIRSACSFFFSRPAASVRGRGLVGQALYNLTGQEI